mgnify:CR=1 FL=1
MIPHSRLWHLIDRCPPGKCEAGCDWSAWIWNCTRIRVAWCVPVRMWCFSENRYPVQSRRRQALAQAVGYNGGVFGQRPRGERSKVASIIMMRQKALATRSSRKGFFAPEGTNADLTKKGLRLTIIPLTSYPSRTNADLTKKGLRRLRFSRTVGEFRTNADLTKKGLRPKIISHI